MMGEGFFDNAFPYNVYGAQPRGGFYRPRASDYDQFWYPSRMRQPASPDDSRGEVERAKARARNVEETPARRNVRTVVVEDGGEKEAESRIAPPQTPQPQKAPAVRFESSDAAASKIQSVYRGYSVRRTEPLKHLRVIRKVKTELEELMLKSGQPDETAKLREDPQVRLKWTEGIMALILRLDSLQGAHPVVRDIRKCVAKELICFQERIDSMADVVKETLTVDNVESVEEGSHAEVENEEVAIDEDVPDSETQKENALATDSNVSAVPEELANVVSSLVEKIDIADDLQSESSESSIVEAEPSIRGNSEACQEIDCSVDSQANPTTSMVNEVRVGLESSSIVADTSEEVADDKLVEGSKTEWVPAEVSPTMELEGENEGLLSMEDIELGEEEKEVVACEIADGDVTNESAIDRISIDGTSGMDVEAENTVSPQVEVGELGTEEEAVIRQNMEETTFLPTAQSHGADNVTASLMSGDNSLEAANATEASECNRLTAGDLEEAADGYRGDNSTSSDDEDLSASPMDASDNAVVVASQPLWTSLISEPRQGDSLQMTPCEPPTTPDDSSLSDRALMLQILEENRKLKAVVGEVLQWGKQQSEVINNLASKVKQLEGDVSDAKLLKDCTHSSRKRLSSIAGPLGERERVVRRLENGRNRVWGNGRQINYITDEQWPSSAESEEFF